MNDNEAQFCAGSAILAMFRQFRDCFGADLFPPAAMELLLVLGAEGRPMTQRAIAGRLGADSNGLQRWIKVVESRRLVETVQNSFGETAYCISRAAKDLIRLNPELVAAEA